MTKYGTQLEINLLRTVINAWELELLKTSVQYFVTCQTDQDLGNNPSENAAVKVDAQVETPVNTQTDGSTLVMSDSSFVAKSQDQTGQDLGKQNYSKLVF